MSEVVPDFIDVMLDDGEVALYIAECSALINTSLRTGTLAITERRVLFIPSEDKAITSLNISVPQIHKVEYFRSVSEVEGTLYVYISNRKATKFDDIVRTYGISLAEIAGYLEAQVRKNRRRGNVSTRSSVAITQTEEQVSEPLTDMPETPNKETKEPTTVSRALEEGAWIFRGPLVPETIDPDERVFYVATCNASAGDKESLGKLLISEYRVLFTPWGGQIDDNIDLLFTKINGIKHKPPILSRDGELYITDSRKKSLHCSSIDRKAGEPLAEIVRYVEDQLQSLRKAKEIRELRKLRNAAQVVEAWERSESAVGYPHNWEDLRKTILARDGYACGNCNAKGSHVVLHVHHIVPLSAGGTNAPTNLKSLCRDCHQRVHGR